MTIFDNMQNDINGFFTASENLLNKMYRQKMDKIFNWFEENRFKNDGDHCRGLNLVFEFADWIDTDEGAEKISEQFDDKPETLEKIRGKFSKGINHYIDGEKKASYPFLF